MNKTFLTLIITLFYAITFAQSNGSLWVPVVESEIPDLGKRYIIPSKYQTWKLDVIQMRSNLLEAPMERTTDADIQPLFLDIPWHLWS